MINTRWRNVVSVPSACCSVTHHRGSKMLSPTASFPMNKTTSVKANMAELLLCGSTAIPWKFMFKVQLKMTGMNRERPVGGWMCRCAEFVCPPGICTSSPNTTNTYSPRMQRLSGYFVFKPAHCGLILAFGEEDEGRKRKRTSYLSQSKASWVRTGTF